MGRKRVIDSDGLYFDSEIMEILGPVGVSLFIRLWALAEDSGVYKPNYSDISLEMGALRDHFPPAHVKQYINRLIQARKILPFESEDGEELHFIRNFHKHQLLTNPIPPKLSIPPFMKCEIKKRPSSGKRYAVFSINKKSLRQFLNELSKTSRPSHEGSQGNHDRSSQPLLGKKSEKSTRTQTRKESSTTSTTSEPVNDRSVTGQLLVNTKGKEKKGNKDRSSVLEDPQLLGDSEKLMRAFSIDPKKDKFPFNWIGQKLKKGWTGEIIVPIFSLCVSEAIRHHKRKPIKNLFTYFETIWTREAQNLRERIRINEHEKRKEEEAAFARTLSRDSPAESVKNSEEVK